MTERKTHAETRRIETWRRAGYGRLLARRARTSWDRDMVIAEPRRLQLEAILEELRRSKTPIDNPRIERALIALIETLLEPGATANSAAPRSE